MKRVKDFLADRTFKVKNGDGISKPRSVPSGVPQGSVLGPLLFLIYINDLPEQLHSFASLFADDLKLIAKTCENKMTQGDLDKLDKWQSDWLLRFNVADLKCKVLHIGSDPRQDYVLGGYTLPYTSSERDLGVVTNERLKWDIHIRASISKARKTMGWIRRNLISREKDDMLTVFKTLIRPHLEYGTQIWNLAAVHGNYAIIMDIENVQRQFTRLIDGLGKMSYPDRLRELKLTTLLERRMRGDLIETFKICNHLVEYRQNLFVISPGRNLRIITDKRGEKVLANRVAKYWNKLPEHLRVIGEDETSILGFKRRLEKYKTENFYKKNHYWELSGVIYSRLKDGNRDKYISYLEDHPAVARRTGRN